MAHWYSNSFVQFTFGVVAGAGAIVLASRGLGILHAFPERTAGIGNERVGFSQSERENRDSVLDRLSPTIPNDDPGYNLSDGMLFSPPDTEENNGLVDMLFQIAKDQAHRDCLIHRGITCNICNASPVCGTRYKCANCLDYDVCEVCETNDHHNRTHVFLKIKYPIPPLANPKAVCLKPFYTGTNLDHVALCWDDINCLKDKTHFDETEIQTLHEQFKTLAPQEQGISREAFNLSLGPLGRQSNLVMDRMFSFYDQNGDGVISFEEFISALSVLVKGSKDEKLRFVFEGYDLEKKGYLVYKDFHDMFKAYFNVSIELVRDYIKTREEEMKAAFDETADKPVSSVFHAPIPNDVGGASGGDIKSVQQPRSGAGGSGGARPLMEAMSQDAIDEMVANVFKCADLDRDGKITFDEFKTWAVLDNTVLAWFDALGTVF
ncbi:uncharacterized protein LOC114536861 [Dendronephthya gigantea]|uniref:uncharacterized protein LOC114536861 n=1 Tax=Dendronephthya gigantea TaxID=151771 RepID=UPI00106C905E|nr:uncharacterized protein LOC114536861 [Dendronephthya gigantea]